jgi:hypothetical protein
MSNPI